MAAALYSFLLGGSWKTTLRWIKKLVLGQVIASSLNNKLSICEKINSKNATQWAMAYIVGFQLAMPVLQLLQRKAFLMLVSSNFLVQLDYHEAFFDTADSKNEAKESLNTPNLCFCQCEEIEFLLCLLTVVISA